jgi:hypothetical protein
LKINNKPLTLATAPANMKISGINPDILTFWRHNI